jgi:hypothetical protein
MSLICDSFAVYVNYATIVRTITRASQRAECGRPGEGASVQRVEPRICKERRRWSSDPATCPDDGASSLKRHLSRVEM